MSILLEAVTEARELRTVAEREYRRALVRASDGGHSLRQIADVAGVGFSTVAFHLRKEKEKRANDAIDITY